MPVSSAKTTIAELGPSQDSDQCALRKASSSYSLGCIFDNPIAFEDSRRKIDLCNDTLDEVGSSFEDMGEEIGQWMMGSEQGRGSSSQNSKQVMPDRGRNEAIVSSKRRPCRRKLPLDEHSETRAFSPSVRRTASRREFLELSFDDSPPRSSGLHHKQEDGGGYCTPVYDVLTPTMCSPIASGGRSRSLEGIASTIKDKAEKWTESESSHRSSRSSSWPTKVEDYSIYPGWSVWNRSSRQRSYRSINHDSPQTSCAPSLRRLPVVKSLHQHLLLASKQQQQQQHPVRVSSGTIAGRPARSLRAMNVDARCVPEEAKVPLLKSRRALKKHPKKKSWEPVTFFAKGLKSLTSKGLPPAGYSFPSVIPLPGCNIPSFEQHVLLKPDKSQDTSCEGACSLASDPILQDGYLQCIFKHGVVSYSFWKDNFDEVFVAKAADSTSTGLKCFTFYKCRRKDKSGWKQCQKSTVNRAGTMTLCSSIYTEVDRRGEVTHYMDSEFSFVDDIPRNKQSSATKNKVKQRSSSSVSSYFKSLWSSSVVNSEREAKELSYRKELAAVSVRVPLKVKKEGVTSGAAGRRNIRPLDKLLRARQFEQKTLAKTPWSSIVGGASETITVVLPAGEHGHPSCGLEGPRPLIERWRSGGLCDCGSWDLGCGIVILTKDFSIVRQGEIDPLNLVIEGRKQKVPVISLAQCQDGLFRLSYREPLISLQAFAAAVAILHSKFDVTDYKDYWSQEWQTKLPVAKDGLKRSGTCHPNPPHSPNDRL